MSILDRYIRANQLYNQGIDAIEAHHDHRAVQLLSRALQINPRYTLAFINRGKLYQKHGSNRSAARNYESALRLDPHDDQTRYRLAVLYETMENLSLSAHHFYRVLINVGWASRPGVRSAVEALRQHRYRSAVAGFHRVLSRLDFH